MNAKKYAEQKEADLNFEEFLNKEGLTYQFEVKVRLPDYIASLRNSDKQKGKKLLPDPSASKTEHMTKAQKMVKKFANATAPIPGHVFFSLTVKNGDEILKTSDVGYTYARESNIAKITPQKGAGQPGFVQNQALKDPRYDFSESFELSKEKFEKTVGFIADSVKNPPNYTWPIAYNCVKFAKKAAKVAGIKSNSVMGLSNLPMETVACLQTRKKLKNLKNAIQKLNKIFSKENNVNQKNNDLSSMLKQRKLRDR